MISVIPRHLEGCVSEALIDTPVVVIQGARQVGKSTLARSIAEHHNAVTYTLDDESTRELVSHDPGAFVRQAPNRLMVIDEAQREPRLVLALKAAVDENRRPGRFLLTGSANLLRLRGSGDSLAGRAESLTLHPFSVGEILAGLDWDSETSAYTLRESPHQVRPDDFVDTLVTNPEQLVSVEASHEDQTPTYADLIIKGGYPEPITRKPQGANRWFHSYMDRLATHDAAELTTGEFPREMQRLIRILAAQPASELVVAKTARHLGMSETATNTYIDLLESMFLLQRVSSWGQGILGRETRRSKVSLVDTGLAASLVGFSASKATSPGGFEYFGALVEQFVVGELHKQREWSQQLYRVYHYRSRSAEVDAVIELSDGSVIGVEVKSSSSTSPAAWRHLETLRTQLGDRFRAGVLLYTGTIAMKVSNNIYLLPLNRLWAQS